VRLDRNVIESDMRSGVVAVTLVGVLLSAGCLSARPIGPATGSPGDGQALGAFALASDRLGRLTLSPSSCTAGDHQVFLGADFTDETAGFVVRVVVDPLEGPAARVFARATPMEQGAVFRRRDCRVFRLSLETTGWRIDHVRDYRIAIDLDCSNADGDSIAGNASATHCH
jgi:hypothetical protein